MNKKLLSFGIASVVLILNSGCAGNQPQIIDHNTTINRTVMIPHSDNVKKAVAILISKTKALEKKVDAMPLTVVCHDNNESNKHLKDALLKEEKKQIQNANDIAILKEKLQAIFLKIEQTDKEKNAPKIKEIIIGPNNSSVDDTQYNAIIKDFVAEDLK